MSSRNEAAERLSGWINSDLSFTHAEPNKWLDEALAAERALERAATVERIRQAIRERLFVDDFDAKETAAASQVLQDVTAFLAEIEQS